MPLVIDTDGSRRRALWTLLNELLIPVRGQMEAAVIVGSLAYNWDDHVFTTSDLDLLLVVEHSRFAEFLAGLHPLPGHQPQVLAAAASYMEHGTVDMVSLKSQRRDVGFTVHVCPLRLFTAMCVWEVRDVRAWRLTAKIAQEVLLGFAGRLVTFEPRNEPLDTGVCHTVPTSLERDGRWFVGIPHGRLLHCPRVVMDRTGGVQLALNRLWNCFLDRFVLESPRPMDLRRHHPLDTLAKARHFGPLARSGLLARTQQYLVTSGVLAENDESLLGGHRAGTGQ
ncbi:MAG: hypothetical protein J5I93_28870 [Pirellulaceae bacterium]|nr:hypothetical protein [Pirellulaceae bacterium]